MPVVDELCPGIVVFAVVDAVVAEVLVEGAVDVAVAEVDEGVLLPRFGLAP